MKNWASFWQGMVSLHPLHKRMLHLKHMNQKTITLLNQTILLRRPPKTMKFKIQKIYMRMILLKLLLK